MRIQTTLDDERGPEHEDERRWDEIESALGSLPDTGHGWDDDPGAWVRLQRRGGAHRSG